MGMDEFEQWLEKNKEISEKIIKSLLAVSGA
jgi:hypothetical protein